MKWLILFITQFILGCASYPPNTHDPYESYNRVMFQINDSLDRHLTQPVAQQYQKLIPLPIRNSVRHFFDNLRDVVSLGSNLLRLEVEKATIDFIRIGLNSTFGIAGFIDLADQLNIPNHKNTLGDTFASWGWQNSHYLVLPLLGPSTVRDALGDSVAYATLWHAGGFLSPQEKIAGSAVNLIDQRVRLLSATAILQDAALDRYIYVRDIYLNVRNHQIQKPSEPDINIDELMDTPEPFPASIE